MLPGDAFSLVLALLLLQNQLDEKLLQLLVAVVDDELLKAVVLQMQEQEKKYESQLAQEVKYYFLRLENS